MKRLFAALCLALTAAPALAQETVDLGTLRDEEIQVVQKLLYPKEDHVEIAMSLGVVAFDPFMVAPKAQFAGGYHLSETMSVEGQLGLGYGIGNATYRELDSPAYGVRPEAYRYLGSLTGGITWSPIYAKMNWMGQRVIHHDVYIPAVAGLTVEQLAWGEKYFAFAPTVGVGIGTRVFRTEGGALRVEIRDDILVENRKQSNTIRVKQNVGIHVGYTILKKGE